MWNQLCHQFFSSHSWPKKPAFCLPPHRFFLDVLFADWNTGTIAWFMPQWQVRAYWFGSSSFHSSKPKPFQPLICCPCDVLSNPLHSPLLNSVIAGRAHMIFCAIAAQWLSHPPHWYNELHQVICHYEFLQAFQEPTCSLSPMKIGQGKFIPLSKILNVKVEHPPNTMTSRDLDSIVKHLLRPIFY